MCKDVQNVNILKNKEILNKSEWIYQNVQHN